MTQYFAPVKLPSLAYFVTLLTEHLLMTMIYYARLIHVYVDIIIDT